MVAKTEERWGALVLAGSVNPYLRDSPFPPTHININYLLDPRSLASDVQMACLYDAQPQGGTGLGPGAM